MNKLNRILTNVSALAAMCLLFCAVSANAATLTVTTTSDAGVGSLRQALNDAITNGAANDIVFALDTATDPNYDPGTERFTITLASELPTIPVSATNITNTMPEGVTIMGNNTRRIFNLVNSAVVVMTNITISNGGGQDTISNGNGGAIYMGNSGTLTLNDCTIANSTSAARGGGIFMNLSATLHVNRSTFTGNTAASSGGAVFVSTSGTMNLNTSTLSGNSATNDYGGAFENNGTVNAVNNTFSGNFAYAGGAIMNFATMTLTSNTLVENGSDWGGGIYNGFAATATLNNNLIALNAATGGGRDLYSDNPFTGTYNLIGIIDGSTGMATSTNKFGDFEMGALDPLVGPLQNNGGPTFTHAILIGSPAHDQGNSPIYLTDQRGYTRPYNDLSIDNAAGGDGSDMGAFEMLAPSAANVSISGQFITSAGKGGQGIANVTVYLTDEAGNVQTARSNGFGYFQFPEVAAGMTYIASAMHRQYQFETKVISVTDEIGGLDWTPMNAAPASSNRTSKSGLR